MKFHCVINCYYHYDCYYYYYYVFTNSYLIDICQLCNFSYYFKGSRSYPRKTHPVPERQSALYGNEQRSIHTIRRCARRECFLLFPVQPVESQNGSISTCSHCSRRASCFTGASSPHWRGCPLRCCLTVQASAAV